MDTCEHELSNTIVSFSLEYLFRTKFRDFLKKIETHNIFNVHRTYLGKDKISE